MTMTTLAVQDVSRSFAGVEVLHAVSLSVTSGQILALVGENGAGKSTLMNILAGVLRPDPGSGSILLDGHPVRFGGVLDARAAGISIIFQELNVFLNLSIAENLLLGNEARFSGPSGVINRGKLDREVRRILASVRLNRAPDTLVASLGVGERQLVEIGKALLRDMRFLILDEPTAALTGQETERLFEILRTLREQGAGIIYISHRLAEVFALADTVAVLRDGQMIATHRVADTSESDLVAEMVGRKIEQLYPHAETAPGPVLLRLSDVSTASIHHVSLQVRAGEIVGLGGMMGSGRTEVARAVAGVDPITAGTMELAGQAVHFHSPRAALAAGIAFVTEDRKYDGLILPFSVRQNLALPSLNARERGSFIDRRAEHAFVRQIADHLRIRLHSVEQSAESLSGGNQQKVVLGKWLARNPQLLIMDEPTRGVDVGAKAEIYGIMNDLKREGKALLMVSSDLPELLGICDRVYVMRDYTIAGELSRQDMSQVALMKLAAGATGAAEGKNTR
ncbi:MAG TPA: sugar ABC transporter ATP-binding protein [Ktedonobacterales bacterium]|nr:sugar ABC transporter ATP-binding protein [Ktedonobacterales bacterium]